MIKKSERSMMFIRLGSIMVAVACTALPLAAQPTNDEVAIPRSVMAAGGMLLQSDGEFVLSGTTGQTVTGIGAAETQRTYHGFWVPIPSVSSVGPNEITTGNGALQLTNSPNPFSNSTTISFSVQSRSRVEVAIVDMSGGEVVRVMDDILQPGEHSVVWNGLNSIGDKAPSGVYTCVVTVADPERETGTTVERAQRKLMLVR